MGYYVQDYIKRHLHCLQPLHQRIAYVCKGAPIDIADGFLGLRLDSERIDGSAVFMYPEVEMRTGGKSCRTYVAYHLFLLHVVADLQSFGKARQVHIGADIDTVVLYLHIVTSTTRLVGLGYYLTTANGINRCARRSCIIYAVMSSIAFKNRMVTAVAEAGGNAVEVKRRFQKSPFQAITMLVIIKFLPVLHKRDSVECTIRGTERCGQYVEVL